MKNEIKTCSKGKKNVKVMQISVENYPSVQPKFTKLNWSNGEGDDNG